MIEYRKGNVCTGPEKYIAHGCNAQGKMNSGVAKEIRARFHYAYDDYLEAHTGGGLVLGTVIESFRFGAPKTILNCITQEYYGKDGKQYASYEAVAKCLEEINKIVTVGAAVAMPRIGCGLGGLKWEYVEELILLYPLNYSVVVYDL